MVVNVQDGEISIQGKVTKLLVRLSTKSRIGCWCNKDFFVNNKQPIFPSIRKKFMLVSRVCSKLKTLFRTRGNSSKICIDAIYVRDIQQLQFHTQL